MIFSMHSLSCSRLSMHSILIDVLFHRQLICCVSSHPYCLLFIGPAGSEDIQSTMSTDEHKGFHCFRGIIFLKHKKCCFDWRWFSSPVELLEVWCKLHNSHGTSLGFLFLLNMAFLFFSILTFCCNCHHLFSHPHLNWQELLFCLVWTAKKKKKKHWGRKLPLPFVPLRLFDQSFTRTLKMTLNPSWHLVAGHILLEKKKKFFK